MAGSIVSSLVYVTSIGAFPAESMTPPPGPGVTPGDYLADIASKINSQAWLVQTLDYNPFSFDGNVAFTYTIGSDPTVKSFSLSLL
jgi:hypothetical protein